MTIETSFHNWQQHTPAPDPAFASCSPNLKAIHDELAKRFGMTDLGCYGWRTIRGGELPSSHGFGGARDLRYFELGRVRAVSEVLPWMIDYSHELHIQAIHDYLGSRIWRAGRTPNVADAKTAWWKAQTPSTANGMGQSWAVYFHVETTLEGWGDSTPIPNRFVLPAPSPLPPPTPTPLPIPTPTPTPNPGGPFVHANVKRGDVNADVFSCQAILRSKFNRREVIADGQFGGITESAVKAFQTSRGLFVDGLVGPKTWAKLDALLNS